MKQIVAVLDAIAAGCETALDVEAVTNIGRKAVSSWLAELCEEGLIVRTHRQSQKTGRPFARYRAAQGATP